MLVRAVAQTDIVDLRVMCYMPSPFVTSTAYMIVCGRQCGEARTLTTAHESRSVLFSAAHIFLTLYSYSKCANSGAFFHTEATRDLGLNSRQRMQGQFGYFDPRGGLVPEDRTQRRMAHEAWVPQPTTPKTQRALRVV